MSRLARVDLNQVPLDRSSFIGQVVAAGLEYEQLPPHFMDSLRAYLRVRGLAFAQRQRTGIALGRDQLRQGMERGLACMDLALEEESDGDLNTAVAKLASDPFDVLYKQGWERAFQRLKEMRQQARGLVGCPELGFWPDLRPKVSALTQLVPETWTGPSAIDLRADGQMLQELTGKVAFVRSLPKPSVAALLEQVEVDFAGVLHRVILALALGRAELEVNEAQVSRFRAECFAAGWAASSRASAGVGPARRALGRCRAGCGSPGADCRRVGCGNRGAGTGCGPWRPSCVLSGASGVAFFA